MQLLFYMENQPTRITGFDSYQSEASGRRVEKMSASGSSGKMFHPYNHAGQLMYQYEPSLSQATNFIHQGTQLIADRAYLLLAMPAAVGFDTNPNSGSYTVNGGAGLAGRAVLPAANATRSYGRTGMYFARSSRNRCNVDASFSSPAVSSRSSLP